MSEAGFTKGPWTWAKYSAKRFGLGQRGEGAFFFLQCVYDDADSPTAIADARLIAAAPELLDALRAVMNYPEVRSYLGRIVSAKADAAIAKATGAAA